MHSGFILVHKPVGPTSFAVIHFLRKITGIKKIGHAGTLDPLASGLMICAVGRDATRRISEMVKMDKEYEVEMCFGVASAGLDLEGPIRITEQITSPGLRKMRQIVARYTGVQSQVPPRRSAKKIGGKKAYELDRSGKEFVLPEQQVVIHSIKIRKMDWPLMKIHVRCSSGTYMRSLVRDIAQDLGTTAVMTSLVRTKIGNFSIGKAHILAQIQKDNWHTFLFLTKK